MGKETRKLALMPISRDVKSSLEISLLENGDFVVEMWGKTLSGRNGYVQSQIRNPLNGGGSPKDYLTLKTIYDSMV